MRGEGEAAAIEGLRSVSLPLGGVWRRCWLAFSAKRVVPLQCSDMTAMAGDDMIKNISNTMVLSRALMCWMLV